MSKDSFFEFDNTSNASPEPPEDVEYDADYDALNFETFGDDPVSDWETAHEKYVSEFKRTVFDDVGSKKKEIAEENSVEGGRKIITVEEIESKIKEDLILKENPQKKPCAVQNTATNVEGEKGENKVVPNPNLSKNLNKQPEIKKRSSREYHNSRYQNQYPSQFRPPYQDINQQRYVHPAHQGMAMPSAPFNYRNQGPRNPRPYHDQRNYPLFRPCPPGPPMSPHFFQEQLVRPPLCNQQVGSSETAAHNLVEKDGPNEFDYNNRLHKNSFSHFKKSSPVPKKYKLFVKDIPLDWTFVHMRRIFSKVGNPTVYLHPPTNDGRPYTWGSVEYKSLKEAQDAIMHISGNVAADNINVSFATKNADENITKINNCGNHKLLVRNIPLDWTDPHMYAIFSKVGNPTSVSINPPTKDGRPYTWGFVEFQNLEEALDAIKYISGNVAADNVTISFATTYSDQNITKINSSKTTKFRRSYHKLYVKNIPLDWTDEKMLEIFSKAGNPASIYINPPKNGQPYTWGFVGYDDFKEAQYAIKFISRNVAADNIIISFASDMINNRSANVEENESVSGCMENGDTEFEIIAEGYMFEAIENGDFKRDRVVFNRALDNVCSRICVLHGEDDVICEAVICESVIYHDVFEQEEHLVFQDNLNPQSPGNTDLRRVHNPQSCLSEETLPIIPEADQINVCDSQTSTTEEDLPSNLQLIDSTFENVDDISEKKRSTCQSAFNRPAPGRPVDEYAGLMSPQEKQWLASIQLMQLNTNQPFHDDYYNRMYNQRHQGRARKSNNKNLPNIGSVTYSRQPAKYVPQQFENSLGKLQVGSVTAPRKIIEMEGPCNNNEPPVKPVDRKSIEQMLEIEQLFNVVLTLEETLNPLNMARGESCSKEKPNIKSLQDDILKRLLEPNKLACIMSIRKGKKLVLRVLSNLASTGDLIHQLLMDLMPIARKDADQYMLGFLPAIRSYLMSVNLSTIVQIVKQYETDFFMATKFSISVMAMMVDRAGRALPECHNQVSIEDWKLTLIRLIESTKNWVSSERPVIAVDPNILEEQISLFQDPIVRKEAEKLVTVLSYPPQCPPRNRTRN